MYGNIAVYGNIALSVDKIDYTLRCLEYICSVSSPYTDATGSRCARALMPLNRGYTDNCTLTITCTFLTCILLENVLDTKRQNWLWHTLSQREREASMFYTFKART